MKPYLILILLLLLTGCSKNNSNDNEVKYDQSVTNLLIHVRDKIELVKTNGVEFVRSFNKAEEKLLEFNLNNHWEVVSTNTVLESKLHPVVTKTNDTWYIKFQESKADELPTTNINGRVWTVYSE